MTKIGMHWIPTHDQNPEIEFIERMKPSVIKIVNPGFFHIHEAYAKSPESLIVLRDHPLSEQKEAMKSDPVGTGLSHAQNWKHRVEALELESVSRGTFFPPRNQIVVLGINEPPVWSHKEQTIQYTATFLEALHGYGIRGGALSLSVGWPASEPNNTSPPNWAPYQRLESIIRDGNHFLFLHEYWGSRGPIDGWGWLAGRYTKCPLQVPIIIGECGIDQFAVDGSVPSHDRGWRKYTSPEMYVAQLKTYYDRLAEDNRIKAMCVFTSDYGSSDWFSFDLEPAYPAIYATDWGIKDMPEKDVLEKDTLSLPLPGSPRVTQCFGDNPGGYTSVKGHTGIDWAVPTGTHILAVDKGEVIESQSLGDWGFYVKIQHSWGHSLYAHMRSLGVPVGTSVERGDVVGFSGSTGNSTGPHLHFGIRLNGYDRGDGWGGWTDPAPYIRNFDCRAKEQPEPKVYEITIPAGKTMIQELTGNKLKIYFR